MLRNRYQNKLLNKYLIIKHQSSWLVVGHAGTFNIKGLSYLIARYHSTISKALVYIGLGGLCTATRRPLRPFCVKARRHSQHSSSRKSSSSLGLLTTSWSDLVHRCAWPCTMLPPCTSTGCRQQFLQLPWVLDTVTCPWHLKVIWCAVVSEASWIGQDWFSGRPFLSVGK